MQETTRLLRIERRDLFLPDLRRVNTCSRVERYQVEPHRLLKSTVQHRVYVPDARGLEVVSELRGVEGLDVRCRELRKLEPAERGGDVPRDLQLVVVVGSVSEVAACGVLYPALHVLRHGLVLIVEVDPFGRVAHSLGQPLLYLLILSAIDVLPLGAVRGLAGVHPLEKSALTLRDPAAFNGHLRPPFS